MISNLTMIPDATVFAFIAAAICTLVLPVILLIVLGIRKKISGLPLLVGVVSFFLSQIVLRIPLLNALSTQTWYQDFTRLYLPYVLALSFSAGLFEESARLGGAVLLKKRRSYRDTVSFGLGHAFCEVILLVGLTHINNIVLCLLINSGNETAVSALLADALASVQNTLVTLNPVDVYWGILERFSAVLFHVFATVLVFQGVRKKQIRYYFFAIAAHTLFNFLAVLIARYMGIAATEIILLILSLAAGVYVIKQKGTFDSDEISRI